MRAQQADYDSSPEGVARRQVAIIDYLERIEALLIKVVNNTSRDGSFMMRLSPIGAGGVCTHGNSLSAQCADCDADAAAAKR